MAKIASFFQTRQKLLGLAVSFYVIMLMFSHWQLPVIHVWVIAAVFSIIMNLVYVTEAFYRKEFFKFEFLIASLLIIASILGVVISPPFVIGAIFGHGIWDIAKHNGVGVPFLNWYTLSCFTVDLIYSAVLLIFWTM